MTLRQQSLTLSLMFCDSMRSRIEVADREVTKLMSENLFSDFNYTYWLRLGVIVNHRLIILLGFVVRIRLHRLIRLPIRQDVNVPDKCLCMFASSDCHILIKNTACIYIIIVTYASQFVKRFD